MASRGGCYDEETPFFYLNGVYHSLASVPVDTSLNTYIREYARLKGTKFMCREGGCGICVVSLCFENPATGEKKTLAVNSCMFPVYACHGFQVTTVEGVGSQQKGYNDVQIRLAQFNGSQCGYCSPGWVMSMYSLLMTNPKATMEEIENSFSGNLCRCTGYRPILDAFKSFASDRTRDLEQKVLDIEDLFNRPSELCSELENKKPKKCFNRQKGVQGKETLHTTDTAVLGRGAVMSQSGPGQWYRVTDVDEIFEIFGMIDGSYMLVGGNTAQGILKGQPHPQCFIDTNGVALLKDHFFHSGSWYLGANTTLSDAIIFFKAVAAESPKYFSYFRQLAHHIEKVANTPVRNVGTLAGNLSIKHQNNSFQSDIFVILETVGAVLSVRSELETITVLSMSDYLQTDMYKKVILQIILPPLDQSLYTFRSYKVAPRAQNALARVNGGFLFQLDKRNRNRVLKKPRIVYGNITPAFIHASQTEEFLTGKSLLDGSTLRGAMELLGREIQPDMRPPEPSPEYRKNLTQALLYRAVLSLSPDLVSPRARSGGEDLTRPVSSGCQEFAIDVIRPPLYQPSTKLDALLQCSGEAEYIYDIPTTGTEVYAALVTAKLGPADLEGLDPTAALKIPGVIAFFSAKDIPGKNTFTPKDPFVPENEELFVSEKILYAGQPLGVIVAVTQSLADLAAEKVVILYSGKQKPVLDLRAVVKSGDVSRITPTKEKIATSKKENIKKVVKGEMKLGTQYHFTMETLTCVVVPVEGQLDVYCSSQWLNQVQETISLLTKLPEHNINVKVRRLGGGYGVKLTRANIVGGAVGLVAYLLNRPARMVMKLETVMESIGKRWPCLFNYEVGVNDEGEIQYLTANMYNDAGSVSNDYVSDYIIVAITNVYDPSTWSAKLHDVRTDKACTAWMRAPGTLEAITMAENILEHIAHELSLDPLAVRMTNIDKSYPILNVISQLKEKSDYDSRKVAVLEFNKKNVWKKRGISLVPLRFPQDLYSSYHAMVSVYRNDGTVALTHGGVEIGQGIDTKAAQTCASTLGIPLAYVKVKPTNNLTSPNDGLTGASYTSESVCYAVEQCCIELNRRLEPFRDKVVWRDIVNAAYENNVSLNVSKMFSATAERKSYQIFGAIVLEVEVDILTGEHKVVRADILQDAGKSLNPMLDIGQIEGAFVMGLGYFTFERIEYEPNKGRVLTNRTLNYKIPGPKDIPVDLRVYIMKNVDNPLGILRTKGVGEPPLCLSVSVMFTIREALEAARRDLGLPNIWLPMDAPFTAENIALSCGIGAKKYFL